MILYNFRTVNKYTIRYCQSETPFIKDCFRWVDENRHVCMYFIDSNSIQKHHPHFHQNNNNVKNIEPSNDRVF